MKTIIYYLFATVLSILVFVSCSDINKFHEPYLKNGEIIYAGRIDSVYTFAGRDRVVFRIFSTTQRADRVVLSWNDQSNTVDFPGSLYTDGYFDHSQPLTEGSYTVRIISHDSYGNASIPSEVIVRSYGESYASALSSRLVKNASVGTDNTLTVDWYAMPSDAEYVELSYTDTGGTAQQQEIPGTESKTVIPDVDSAADVTYRTAYLPEENAVDTFYSSTRSVFD